MAFSGEWISFREKVFIILKRKWVLVTFLVVVMTVVIIATFTATPLYRASARLIIEPRMPKVMPFEELFTIGGRQLDYYNTQYKILTSPSLAEMVIEDLKTRKDQLKLSRKQVESLNVDRLLAMVKIVPISQSYAVDIQVIGPDPKMTSIIANTWARQYIRHEIEAKMASTRQALSQLESRLMEQSEKVQQAQRELQDYKERERIVSLENRQTIIERDLSELSSLYLQARQERLNKEHELSQLLKYAPGDPALEGFPVIMRNPIVQRLKSQLVSVQGVISEYSQRYKEQHPKMQQVQAEKASLDAKLQEEITKIIEGMRKEYEISLNNEEKLSQELEGLKEKALSIDRKKIRYSALEDHVASARKIYEALLERVNEASMSGQIEVSNIRVLDDARTPQYPFKPRKGFNLLLGFVLGAVGGVGLIFLMENLDDTLKTSSDIKNHLKLPLLGAIPIYEQIDGQELAGLPVLARPMGVIAESFRSIRTSIHFAFMDNSPRVILVTSSMPREGKTDIVAQLGVVLAQADEKVLVVDSDLRKPRLSKLFRRSGSGPGLSEFLRGEAELKDIIYTSEDGSLEVIPGGDPPQNPAELLNLPRFRQFIEFARGNWDRVIMDSPPLVSVTDAAILSRYADGVVYVVRSGAISWKKAVHGREQLQAVQAEILGVVLNAVDVNRSEYYHYYRSYY
ncbi:MAG TPA: polysaccharide biosynthesis tyrosine autokinase [bacterium]|nr:polysaccharide biosynthesis tyrosine autokinase [bacterium]HPQ65726.1 polysaccharide biosynthesis tyrosine autokinase [bacterium]